MKTRQELIEMKQKYEGVVAELDTKIGRNQYEMERAEETKANKNKMLKLREEREDLVQRKVVAFNRLLTIMVILDEDDELAKVNGYKDMKFILMDKEIWMKRYNSVNNAEAVQLGRFNSDEFAKLFHTAICRETKTELKDSGRMLTCPVCRQKLDKLTHYCPECGQRLS